MALHINELTHDQLVAYEKHCEEGHDWQVSVSLLNRADDVLVSLDEGGGGGGRRVTVVDGGVTCAGPKRVLRLTVADPDRDLAVVQDGHFIDRQLAVSIGIYVPALLDTVWAEVFHGPIWAAPRTDDLIQFVAHGRERYAQHGISDTYMLGEGMPVTTAIKRVLHDLVGEVDAHMGNIPDLAPVLKEDLILELRSSPRQVLNDLAQNVGRYLCWGGDGDIEMPRMDSSDPEIVFSGAQDPESPNAHLIVADNPPTVEVSQDDLRNAVHITGGATKGSKPPIGIKVAHSSEYPDFPFTVENIGYLWDFRDMPLLKKQAGVDGAAQNILTNNITGSKRVSFEIIPVPWLRFGMPCGLSTIGASEFFHLTNFGEIPLFIGDGATMAIGFHKRASANRFASQRG